MMIEEKKKSTNIAGRRVNFGKEIGEESQGVFLFSQLLNG